uniref:N-acetyltransferase domain-containing protein n=1 Tax=viral metagenome TaxID=1070528 RepID=A0A6C0J875_9ZZZZ
MGLVLTPDGVLQTGWIVNNQEQSHELGKYLESNKIKLCSPKGTDFSRDIIEVLTYHEASDILVKAENGKYQSILAARRKTDNTFHIEYLCSAYPGAGEWLLNKVKEFVKENRDKFNAVTLYPYTHDLRSYYISRGFVEIPGRLVVEWRPPSGGRRKTRRMTRRMRTRSRRH